MPICIAATLQGQAIFHITLPSLPPSPFGSHVGGSHLCLSAAPSLDPERGARQAAASFARARAIAALWRRSEGSRGPAHPATPTGPPMVKRRGRRALVTERSIAKQKLGEARPPVPRRAPAAGGRRAASTGGEAPHGKAARGDGLLELHACRGGGARSYLWRGSPNDYPLSRLCAQRCARDCRHASEAARFPSDEGCVTTRVLWYEFPGYKSQYPCRVCFDHANDCARVSAICCASCCAIIVLWRRSRCKSPAARRAPRTPRGRGRENADRRACRDRGGPAKLAPNKPH